MKLSKETENVLLLMAPTWMKRLKLAKWSKEKLSSHSQTILNSDAAHCFIGEVHCMTKDYVKGHETACTRCGVLCEDVPRIMRQHRTIEDKIQVLDSIADHIVNMHPDLLARKVQIRAHKVFK